MTILDPATAKAFLRGTATVTGGDLDDTVLMQGYLDAVDAVIEDLVGPVTVRAQTLTVAGGRPILVLPYRVKSVDQITERGALVDTVAYSVDPVAGLVKRNAGQWADGTVELVVTVGRNPIPGNIVLAAKELLRHLWSPRQGTRPAFGGSTPDSSVYVPSGFAVPHRVAELLEPHARLGGFA